MAYVNTLTMISNSATPQSGCESKDLINQVALDLANYLDGFSNKNFGIRILANESDVNERTIKRLLSRKNHPSGGTLLKLYTAFTGKFELEQVLRACPDLVRREIEARCPDKKGNKKYCKTNFLALIEKDPLLGELYVLAGTGPLYKDSVVFRYGQYGLELLEKLESLHILKLIDKNTYGLGLNSPTFTAAVIKELGSRFVSRYSKPELADVKGNNVMNFYAEGLNDEGLQAWIKADEEAFMAKVKIANDPKFKGSIPVFTFNTTDTMESEK